MVIAAEEFPAERRGTVLGVISAAAGLGSVLCAGVVPALSAAFSWRAVYFVGVIPLIIMAFARRSLRETRRFEEQVKTADQGSLLAIWRSPYRRRRSRATARDTDGSSSTVSSAGLPGAGWDTNSLPVSSAGLPGAGWDTNSLPSRR